MHPNDIILTGVPRGGTTVTCELLSEVDDTVALDEPMGKDSWLVPTPSFASRVVHKIRRTMGRPSEIPIGPEIPAERHVSNIDTYFTETRRRLMAHEPIETNQVGGKILGSRMSATSFDETGRRERLATRDPIVWDRPLTDDFVLVIKQNAGFIALLPDLAKRFPTFAIVRNPLAVLGSWQTVSIPVNIGRLPRGEDIDRALRKRLAETEDVHDRQFILLDWIFGMFRSTLPMSQIVKYEEIVDDAAVALSRISPNATRLTRRLESRNRSSLYKEDLTRRLGERLLATDGPWWEYYTKDSVSALMA